jgi:photosystem II stability/assembly factor-like uncharacterized protein
MSKKMKYSVRIASILNMLCIIFLASVGRAQLSTQDTTTLAAQGQLGWVKVNGETSLTVINDISFPSRDTAYAFGSSTVFRSIDGGDTWQEFSTPTSGLGSFPDSKNGYAVGNDSIPYHTGDGGSTWTALADDFIMPPSALLAVTKDTAFVIGYGIGISRTTDAGKTWALTPPTSFGFYGLSIDFYDSKNGVIVGALQGGPMPSQFGAACFTTSNAGATWIQQLAGADGIFYGTTYVTKDTIIGAGRFGYNGVSAAILRSTNGGITWDPVITPLIKASDAASAVAHKGNRSILVVGSSILTSTDRGLTWLMENSGVTTGLSSIAMLDATTALVGGVQGTILKTTNGGTDWVQVSPPSSQSLTVLSFQDPETPNVEIVYDLPQLQNVKAIVYNLMGKQIATLANGELQQPGKQRLIFNGNAVPSGTYLITLTTNRYHATGKFEITH